MMKKTALILLLCAMVLAAGIMPITTSAAYDGAAPVTGQLPQQQAAAAGDMQLSDLNATIYRLLRGYIAEVAAGSRSSTVFAIAVEDLALEKTSWTADELGVAAIAVDDSITEEAISAVMEKTAFDLGLIVNALQADCPYELFWYDKSAESAVAYESLSIEANFDGEWTIAVAGSLTFSFKVASDYSAGDYTVAADKVLAAHEAVENAEAIVAEYADYPDEMKLRAYKDAICSLVTYDHDAADGDKPYGAPWQMISVFDGSEATNVVCEGYSKAFKYLCDISRFEGSITCITVTGTMDDGTGAEDHMWNIVSIDGANYLVDVTNCDEGSAGADDLLFMKGGLRGSAAAGYAFHCGIATVVYQYDAETKGLWDESSLALSAADYVYYSGNCGDHAAWSFDCETGILTISGTGDLYNWMTIFEEGTGLPIPGLSPPWYFVGKDNIIGVVIEPGITRIGASSFSHCKNLDWISIPDTVTSIGSMTFMYSGIKSLTIPDSVTGSLGYQFCCHCEDLETVSIGNGITEVGHSAFLECHKLKSVVMGTSVKSIGTSAFHGCNALESITLPDGSVGLPDGVKVIGEHAFYICESLKSLRLPAGVEEIGTEAFASCKSLTGEVTWPAGIKTVIDGAFRFCESLEKVVIPDGVTAIGYVAFSSSGIKKITLPDTVEQIGEYSFGWCYSLEQVILPPKITSIPEGSFCFCEDLEEVYIPSGVTSIGDNAFGSCSSLEDVYYAGTQAEWEKIKIGSSNELLTGAAIHFGKITVSFNANAGDAAGTMAAQTIPSNTAAVLTANAFSREDYIFTGWNTAADGSGDSYADEAEATLDADLTLYAQWAPSTIAIVFVDEDGSVLQSGVVAFGAVPAYNGGTPVKAADEEYIYTFAGWTPEPAAVTGEAVYTAVYTAAARTYGEPVWTWTGSDAEGYTAAKAVFATNDGGTEFTKEITDDQLSKEHTPPACILPGSDVYTATITFKGAEYSQTKTVVIPAAGHISGDARQENRVDATCTAAGSCDEVVYCTVCHEELSREPKTIEKLAHTTGEAVRENEVAATCSSKGSYDEVIYCTVCHEELSREPKTIEKLAHTTGEAVRENEVAATCSSAGSYDEVVYCTICHEELSRETKSIKKLVHTPGEAVRENEVAATCRSEGSYDEVVYCTVCHEELSRALKTIEKLEHTPGEPVREHEVPATNTADGSYDEVVYCAACHEELSRETRTIEKTAAGPGPIGSVTAKAEAGKTTLTWTASEGATAYIIQRRVKDGDIWTTLRSNVTGTSYEDTTGEAGTVYQYRVRGRNGTGYGPFKVSGVVRAQAGSAAPAAPGAISSVTAKAEAGKTTITWTASEGATAYIIQRRVKDGDTWTTLRSNVTGTSYEDTTGEAGTVYQYRVRGRDGTSYGPFKVSSVVRAQAAK